jgi:hypothetical protein
MVKSLAADGCGKDETAALILDRVRLHISTRISTASQTTMSHTSASAFLPKISATQTGHLGYWTTLIVLITTFRNPPWNTGGHHFNRIRFASNADSEVFRPKGKTEFDFKIVTTVDGTKERALKRCGDFI